jgi:hypothetical protein
MGLIGSIISGIFGDKAADAQVESANQASETLWNMYSQNRQDLAPWRESGGAAVNQLNYLMGLSPTTNYGTQGGNNPAGSASYLNGTDARQYLNPMAQIAIKEPMMVDSRGQRMIPQDVVLRPGQSVGQQTGNPIQFKPFEGAASGFGSLVKDFSAADFQKDPGYEFRLAEGQKALDRSAAAKGNLFSGGTLKANDRYNQGFASNEYGNAFNRFNTNKMNRYNMLSNMAGMGQVSAGQTAQLGANTATQVGNNQMYAGNARASGYANWGNSINNALGGAQNSLISMAGMGII